MKGYKFIGYVKSTKYNQIDKIYYNPWRDKFKCIDKEGKERKLSEKNQNYLYQKFHIRCNRMKILSVSLVLGILGIAFTLKYKDVFPIFLEEAKIVDNEESTNSLIAVFNKQMDKNSFFSKEQKEYLKEAWRKYLEENSHYHSMGELINLCVNLKDWQIEYDDSIETSFLDRTEFKISLSKNYPYEHQALFQETLYFFLEDKLNESTSGLSLGYINALSKKYGEGDLIYKTENEYLLLISEIIGKENLIYFMETGEEEEFYEYFASITKNSIEEIKDLIQLTKIRLLYESANNEQKATELDKAIRKILFNWAIKVDERNKENLILLNVLDSDYSLISSFLEEEYIFKKNGVDEYQTINGKNKYELTNAELIQKYPNISEDVSRLLKQYLLDEKILKESRNVNELIILCHKYIDVNDNYSEEQKEYLKKTWKNYLIDQGIYFELNASLEMLENLTTINIAYESTKDSTILGDYSASNHIITLYEGYDLNTILHETEHASKTDETNNFWWLHEGYAGAVCGAYGSRLTYYDENEYLLLISEIIGKEEVIKNIINKTEEEILQQLSDKTGESIENIKELNNKMYNKMLSSYYEKHEEEDRLNMEIKTELAELAIKADENNKENFIILNALQNKYQLKTSFLSDDYYFIGQLVEYTINDENKYDYTYLFEENQILAKIHNK